MLESQPDSLCIPDLIKCGWEQHESKHLFKKPELINHVLGKLARQMKMERKSFPAFCSRVFKESHVMEQQGTIPEHQGIADDEGRRGGEAVGQQGQFEHCPGHWDVSEIFG